MLITQNLFRLLGHFVPAAKDLRMACKLDFDEVADEWLKEVTPNVSTILFTYIIRYFNAQTLYSDELPISKANQ